MTRVSVSFSVMLAAAGIALGLQSTPADAARYQLTYEDAKQICHQLDARFYGTEKTRYGCDRQDPVTKKRKKVYECTGSVCYGIATRNLRTPPKTKRTPTGESDWQMLSERGIRGTGNGGEGGGGGGGGGGTGR